MCWWDPLTDSCPYLVLWPACSERTWRWGRAGGPSIYQIRLNCQENISIFSLLSFPKVFVGLFLQQKLHKSHALIHWPHMRLLSLMQKDEGQTSLLIKWMYSFIQEQYVWWITGPQTLGKCLSPLSSDDFCCPDALEFLHSLKFLTLSVFSSTHCLLSINQLWIPVK